MRVDLKQLRDTLSHTYTYVLADTAMGKAVLIDPVREHAEEYLALLLEEGLELKHILETHVHADHITGASTLRAKTGARTAVGRRCETLCADLQLDGGESLAFGNEVAHVIATPGHTAGSVCYLWRDRLFTGDTLLIGGCGRTDFQNGDPGALYDSITGKLFTLPDETLVYPGHDYNGRRVSSIAQERETNPRLAGKTREEFIKLMGELALAKPEFIDEAVPANRRCGQAAGSQQA